MFGMSLEVHSDAGENQNGATRKYGRNNRKTKKQTNLDMRRDNLKKETFSNYSSSLV